MNKTILLLILLFLLILGCIKKTTSMKFEYDRLHEKNAVEINNDHKDYLQLLFKATKKVKRYGYDLNILKCRILTDGDYYYVIYSLIREKNIIRVGGGAIVVFDLHELKCVRIVLSE